MNARGTKRGRARPIAARRYGRWRRPATWLAACGLCAATVTARTPAASQDAGTPAATRPDSMMVAASGSGGGSGAEPEAAPRRPWRWSGRRRGADRGAAGAAETGGGPAGPAPPAERNGFRRSVGPLQQFNVHLELGRVYETQGQFEAAVIEYQKALQACDLRGGEGSYKEQRARRGLAERRTAAALDRLGRFAQAEAHYRAALRHAPHDARVWNDAGYSYYLQGRWADAVRCLKTATRMAPTDARSQTNLGLALAASGKEAEALEALSKAGGQAVGHANLGYLLAAEGKPAAAAGHYRKALELRPQLAEARVALAQLERIGTSGRSLAAQPPAAGRPDPALRRTALPTATTALPPLPAAPK